MRINNNIMAMNTHRQYGVNNNNAAKSVEKLSSGYRVNRAGDDAAGLAISEKMRAQIRGLNMASKNSQDAVSLVQTAEGALQSTHDILQRMRELAVQSSSDSNETTIDRDALNKEFQALLKEIDDTAAKTKFNDMGVIDGTYAGAAASAAALVPTAALTNDTFADSANHGITGMTLDVSGITLEEGVSFDAGALTATEANDQTDVTFELDLGAAGKFTSGEVDLTSDDLSAIELVNADSGEKVILSLEGTYATGKLTELKADIVKVAGEITLEEPAPADPAAPTIDKIATTGTTGSHGITGINIELGDWAQGTELNGAEISNIKFIDGGSGGDASKFSVDIGGVTFTSATLDLATGIDLSEAMTLTDADGNEITVTFEGGAASFDKTKSDGFMTDNAALTGAVNEDGVAADDAIVGKDFVVQTGANKGDELRINIAAMDVNSLFGASVQSKYKDVDGTNTVGPDLKAKVSELNISDQASASKSIQWVNNAINEVSSQRADLGALQNRLEFKISNLDTSAENLQAAEARIRDLDMAKEMTTFTKNNILSQASTAMLAQANSLPQGVLQLLR